MAEPADEPSPPQTLTEWLRSRSDRQLTELLRLRPDLALPAPPDLVALAGRISVRTSTQRAVDALDAAALRALEGLAAGADPDGRVHGPVPDALVDRALVWGEHLAPAVREVLGPYPGGLGRPAAALRDDPGPLEDPAWVRAQIDASDPDEREILDRLAAGPPAGTLRSAGGDSPAHRLIARGLLIPTDALRVELPREVALALRGTPGSTDGHEPAVATVDRAPEELDRLATTAVLEFVRLVEALADAWTAAPPPTLRSGGLGVRDLRRTTKDLDVPEAVTALVLETSYAAGLINSTHGTEPVFLPTAAYDSWRDRPTAQRWIALADAWLQMTRQPSLVGVRGDRDRVITALGPDAERGTLPTLRRQVLDLLVALPPGAAPADRGDVLARLTWQQPRRASSLRPLAAAILAEADQLGLTVAGGLTGWSRTLLAGAAGAAEHALDNALPAPVDHFLVQPDLTVVVPGPPEPELGRELAAVADLESTGGASVYRITERSVRRALDSGRSATQLAAFVAARSRTPVPQALEYLIDDAARRHGVLRTGAAGAYLRCDDESLLTRVVGEKAVAPLGLRRIAPTVVIADASVVRVLEVLRAAGFAPAAEAPDGQLVVLGTDPPRAPERPPSRPMIVRGGGHDSDAQRAATVRRMRAADSLATSPSVRLDIPGVTSAATMELLRAAIRDDRTVWFGAAQSDGTTTTHTMRPISLGGGMLRGYEPGRSGLGSYPVHRITSVRVVEEEDEDA